MDYLDNLAQGDFNTYLQDDKINSSKHRDFLKDLEIIGNNNLKALYLGINEKQERKDKGMIESDFKESKKKESRERNNNNENKDNQTNNRSSINNQNNKTSTKQSRPKLIGRLATTIVDTKRLDSESEERKREGEEQVTERLSKYFTISDVTKTNQKTAYFSNAQLIELNKKEAMILENYKKLQSLALNCDKIVDWIGYKPNVNSGVRVDVVNENLPNSSKKGKSQHTKCEAFDLGFNSKSDLKKVYLAIKNNQIPNLDNQVFSQVILEKFSSSKIGWLHIGLKTPTWTRGTEFKISYNGSRYINFDGTQAMIDKF